MGIKELRKKIQREVVWLAETADKEAVLRELRNIEQTVAGCRESVSEQQAEAVSK